MVQALGYSIGDFDPNDPGRLCRGRERWIDSYPNEDRLLFHRVVVSGATFSDDSARDAMRGLAWSGVTGGEITRTLFPTASLVAWAEDAHPHAVPTKAQGLEHYVLRRPGSSLRRWVTRWSMPCVSSMDVDDAIAGGADVFLVLDEAPATVETPIPVEDAPLADADAEPARAGGLPESLRQGLFYLVGQRVEGPPSRNFQPIALTPLFHEARAVVLLHQDKHGPCIGVYSPEPLFDEEIIARLARVRGALPVPFAIPPMLARWDRALWELRQDWSEAQSGEFPVPPAPDTRGGWGRRRTSGAAQAPGEEEEEE